MKSITLICFLLCNAFGIFAQEKKAVFFDFDQFDLNESAKQQLNVWVTEIKNIEVIKIYGFCDWKGTNNYNDSLSVKRVKAVYNFLKSKNIKVVSGFEIRGFGEDFEQSKVQSENRKVLIVYNIKSEVKTTIISNDSLNLIDKFKVSKVGDLIKLKDIKFFNMSPRILPKSKPILYDLLCVLQDNPNLKIEIQGHICCQINGDVNNLSVLRAKAVYNYLVSQRINRKRLTFKGYGTTKPVNPIPEKSEKEEEENRRVEILILEN